MEKYRFMMIGAHPDDLELKCGGLAMHLRRHGHEVMFLTMTDGSAGHHILDRETIKARRAKEASIAAEILGVTYKIMPIPDAELEPSLENRKKLMHEIRTFAPHVIFTHRTIDYHPDHRACGQLVMDCSYLVNVPLFCPEVACPPHTPAILSLSDAFTRPIPFRPDLIVPVDDVAEQKIDSLLCHDSQYYEWLPHVDRWTEIENAESMQEKSRLLRERIHQDLKQEACLWADKMPAGVQYVEAFEWNEYGAPLSEVLRAIITTL